MNDYKLNEERGVVELAEKPEGKTDKVVETYNS